MSFRCEPRPRARAVAWMAAALSLTAAARGAAPATAPTTAPAAAGTPAVADTLKSDLAAFRRSFTGPELLTDAKAREAAAPAVLPPMRKVYADFGALADADPAAKEQADSARAEFTTMMATFGDADAAARLSAQADSKDPAVAATGKSGLLLVQWWTTAQDPAAQAKVVDQAEVLAKADPASVPLTEQLLTMTQIGSSGPALTARVQGLVTGVMKNEAADGARPQIEAQQKLAALVGKPLTITGQSTDGKPFTTADWRGKVVLVDFWATWCPPCKAELPRLEQVYADGHAQGLEVVGVSNDRTAEALTTFVAADPKMPWPQLFDPAAAAAGQWNSVTQGFGIYGIPTLFLIDRQGVCRSVEPLGAVERMLPKLLADK